MNSNDTPTPLPNRLPSASSPVVLKTPESNTLYIRLWPKTPLLYPLAILALICGIMSSNDSPPTQSDHVLGATFLAAFCFTLFIITVDVGLTWALLGVAALMIIGLTSFIINIYYPFFKNILPIVEGFNPAANPSFYFSILIIWLILMLISLAISRFHYIRVEPNEIVVVGGVLEKRKRYSTQGLRYQKEVADAFEYYLPFVKSGRLVLRCLQEDEALVLDHVMHIEATIKNMERITGVIQIAPVKSTLPHSNT